MKGYRKYWHGTWFYYNNSVDKATKTTDKQTSTAIEYLPYRCTKLPSASVDQINSLHEYLNSKLKKTQKRKKYSRYSCFLGWCIKNTCLSCGVVQGYNVSPSKSEQKEALEKVTGINPFDIFEIRNHGPFTVYIKVYPYLYDLSGSFSVGTLKGTRWSYYNANEKRYKDELESIKYTKYACYTPVSGKQPLFRIMSKGFNAYMKAAPEINDRTFPAIWIKGPSSGDNVSQGFFYARMFNHIEKWDTDNYTFYYEDDCQKIDKSTESFYNGTEEDEEKVEDNDDDDEDEDLETEYNEKKIHHHHKQYEYGIWSTKSSNSIRKSYDAPYVWPFTHCDAGIGFTGSSSQTFTVADGTVSTFTLEMP